MTLLDTLDRTKRYHLSCLATSEIADTIYTNIKKVTGTSAAGMITVSTKAQFERLLDLLPVWPLDGDYWFIKVELKGLMPLAERLVEVFSRSETCYVWFDSANYGQYKTIMDLFKNTNEKVNGMYVSRMSLKEMEMIVGDWGDRFTPNLMTFLHDEYKHDTDAPYKIRDLLESDLDIDSTRDIVKYLGVSDRNIRTFAYRLLRLNKYTSRVGTSRNRLVQSTVSFLGSISPLHLRRNLLLEVERILHTKMIHQTGTVVDILPLKYMFQYPELFTFDRKAARKIVEGLYEDAGDAVITDADKVLAIRESIHPKSKMARWEIETKIPELSLQRIQRLYLALKGTYDEYEWYTELDAMGFIHTWLSQEIDMLNKHPKAVASVEILRLGN